MSERILIAGRPFTGKTTLALSLAKDFGYPVKHADTLNENLDWSEQSSEVLIWMESPGPWVIEGVTVVRSIRKWFDHGAKGTPADTIYWGADPFQILSPHQRRLGDGCNTIWISILERLRKLGVEIKKIEKQATSLRAGG